MLMLPYTDKQAPRNPLALWRIQALVKKEADSTAMCGRAQLRHASSARNLASEPREKTPAKLCAAGLARANNIRAACGAEVTGPIICAGSSRLLRNEP